MKRKRRNNKSEHARTLAECDPNDEQIELNKDKHTAYYSALIEAWLGTRMEKDKSLLMVSAGGIGVLITLLTTTGVHSRLVGFLFAVALVSFLASIIIAISIFGRNANYIHCLINNKSAEDRDLRWMDKLMFWSFLLGVLLSILIGTFSGIIRFQNQEATMNRESQVNSNAAPPVEKRSYSGLSELRPSESPSSGQGQQSGGSNQGGSSSSNQSSESSQSSTQNANK